LPNPGTFEGLHKEVKGTIKSPILNISKEKDVKSIKYLKITFSNWRILVSIGCLSLAVCLLLSFNLILFAATFLTNHLFDGGRADLTKVLSQHLQVTHSFSMGSTISSPMYNFGAAYIGTNVSSKF
jgi:hypothetical protein